MKEERTGSEIAIRIDNTLTQDATGMMAYLQFEAIGIDRVMTELSVSFVDHNTLQTDFRMRMIMISAICAQRYGIYFSRLKRHLHQLFLERFAKPGNTLSVG